MINLYGVAGRVFSGRLDDLRKIRPVGGKPRVDALPDAGADFHLNLAWAADEAGHAGSAEHGGGGARRAGVAGPGAAVGAAADGVGAYRAAAKPPRALLHRTSDLMSHPALTLDEATTAREAWEMLAEHGVSQAPVLGATGRLVGLVGRQELAPGPDVTDVLRHWRQPVGRLMRTPVPAVEIETDLRHAAQALLTTGLPGLPVVDEAGAVLGFLSRTDLLRGLAQDPPLDLWA